MAAGAFLAGAVLGAAAGAGLAAWACARARLRRGRLFSFALHEVNTPATAVNMTVINLLTGVFGEVPADQLRWLEMARDQLGRLCGLTGDLRDLTHLELQGKLRLHLRPADPAELVEEALSPLRAGFVQAGAPLEVVVAPGLPPILADADRLPRALGGLLYHARKFRASGPVRLSVRREGAFVACEVSYTGTPLSPAQARDSLDLYYPARRRDDHVLAATGLGLGLTRTLARLGGGDLALEPGEKGAARLILTVPVAPAA